VGSAGSGRYVSKLTSRKVGGGVSSAITCSVETTGSRFDKAMGTGAAYGWQDRGVQSLYPAVPADLGYDDLAELYAYPAGRSWVRANFVSSLDGAAQGGDDRSASLSSKGDRLILGLLRSLSDVVVVGATTARVEGYQPILPGDARAALRSRLGLTPLPAIAVVSRSLQIDPVLVAGGDAPTLVITTESSPQQERDELASRAEVIVAGRTSVDFSLAKEELASRGYRRILCEGGPTVMRDLVASGAMDELCLTISPLVVAGERLRLTRGAGIDPPERLVLRSVLADDDVLFCRYTRAPG